MKTHPESVWIDGDSVDYARKHGVLLAAVSVDKCESVNDLEFVPASAYLELKAELEKANAQLATQTANMVKLRKFVEQIANDELEEHGESLVCAAQDLIMELSK